MKKRRLTIHHILPGLVLAFTLFIFAPVDLYLSIGDDLWFPMSTLFRWLAIFAAAAAIFLSTFGRADVAVDKVILVGAGFSLKTRNITRPKIETA